MDHDDHGPKHRGRLHLLLPLLAATLLLAPSCRRLRPGGVPAPPAAESRPVTARGDLAADEKATIELFR